MAAASCKGEVWSIDHLDGPRCDQVCGRTSSLRASDLIGRPFAACTPSDPSDASPGLFAWHPPGPSDDGAANTVVHAGTFRTPRLPVGYTLHPNVATVADELEINADTQEVQLVLRGRDGEDYMSFGRYVSADNGASIDILNKFEPGCALRMSCQGAALHFGPIDSSCELAARTDISVADRFFDACRAGEPLPHFVPAAGTHAVADTMYKRGTERKRDVVHRFSVDPGRRTLSMDREGFAGSCHVDTSYEQTDDGSLVLRWPGLRGDECEARALCEGATLVIGDGSEGFVPRRCARASCSGDATLYGRFAGVCAAVSTR